MDDALTQLKVSELRKILVDNFGLTKGDANKIKGKTSLIDTIEEYQKNRENMDQKQDPDEVEGINDLLDGLETPGEDEVISIMQELDSIAGTIDTSKDDDVDDLPMNDLPMNDLPTNDLAVDDSLNNSLNDKACQPSDPEWTDYVLSALTDDEKIKDKNNPGKEYPTTDGLRRLVEKFVGTIVTSRTQIHQMPSPDNERRATVTVEVEIIPRDRYTLTRTSLLTFEGAADVYSGNSVIPFCNHPVATAETKSEGRAYKKALKIKVSTYEEIGQTLSAQDAQSEYYDDSPNPVYIKDDQINFLDMLCQRLDINVAEFIKYCFPNFKQELSKLPYDEAGTLLAELQTYQGEGTKKKPKKEIKDIMKGYRANWQEVWYRSVV
jgi:hypothetical protein